MIEERMLTTGEFAALFRISMTQARRWAARYPKQLGPVKTTPAGEWRWPESKARAALINGLHEEDRTL